MRLLLLFLVFVLAGCGKNQTLYFYSLDKSQCITVMDKGDVRYVIDGKHSKVPTSDYVKLNISRIDRVRDVIYLCWQTEEYEWDLVSNLSVIIESKLDTARFRFNNELPKDERGIPHQKKFSKGNCAVFDFYTMKLIPDKGAIVEID